MRDCGMELHAASGISLPVYPGGFIKHMKP
jgi:hypothetical protein